MFVYMFNKDINAYEKYELKINKCLCTTNLEMETLDEMWNVCLCVLHM